MRFALATPLVLLVALTVLAACEPTPRPDYAIRVIPNPYGTGQIAVPPVCPDWTTQDANYFDHQPPPQFGCADARNLALGVEQPNDLLQGRPMGPSSGVTAVGSILRYNTGQTRGLIDPNSASTSSVAVTTASNPTSAISGDPGAASAGTGGGSTAATGAAGASSAAGALPGP